MTIVFPSKAVADGILKEICRTPGSAILDGAGEAIWVWMQPDSDTNTVSYAMSADGRCAIAYPFSEIVEDWLTGYIADWLAANGEKAGAVTYQAEGLPGDWVFPTN